MLTFEVSEQQFQDLLEARLGSFWNRALVLFRNCGKNLAYDITFVLVHAANQGKAEEVLKVLEEHYESTLKFQPMEIRGIAGKTFINATPTQSMFLHILREILGIQPVD